MSTPTMPATTPTLMTNTVNLLSAMRLQIWLSPVFPIGGFAYSHGLERAVHDAVVHDEESLALWLHSLLIYGAPWNDAVLLAASWQKARDGAPFDEMIELGSAMAISSERQLETMAQGQAFLDALGHWPLPEGFSKPENAPLPVAIGLICGVLEVPLDAGISAYLQAFTNNQLQASIRLSVLGQKGAARLMARFEPLVLELAEKAAKTTLDDLASTSIQGDIMAMKHEAQTTRLFRS